MREFLERLKSLTLHNPSCEYKNFLVIAYRELRLLELEAVRILSAGSMRKTGQFELPLALCNVDQFYGIEIEEFPAQIAQTALWMMGHQINALLSVATGQNCIRLSLKASAIIVHGNALRLDWREVVKPEKLSYISKNLAFWGVEVPDLSATRLNTRATGPSSVLQTTAARNGESWLERFRPVFSCVLEDQTLTKVDNISNVLMY